MAFTHLNRLVAFKMLETRKLTRQILARGAESNAFKFYLVDHPDEEARWQAGDVDTAYRHFLLWQCAEMAKEIKVLFDPDNLASRLFPRPRVLKDLLDMLNAPALQGAWTEDETIGWVYQDFNEKEKADVFERLYKQKQKIRREDIPAATQLFTPRWIVSWLVQNTLGRHWLQMHPDSRLAERLNYLVPLGGEIPPVPLKKVREIEVLDPACGTMHFGLVAFDLLIEMYKEELEKAGSSEWPQEPSVTREEDIPASIIANNLFGIDIDLRAVQLSALTLYLKAKSVNPSAKIQQSNLVCADVLLLDGERLDAFLKAMRFTRPIYERIIRALWVRLKDASHVGSLLRPEEDIRSLIQREREQYRREGEGRLPFPELQQFFEKEAGEEEFWSILEAQIIQAFDEFARQQAQHGADETYFVGEATKGMRLLDIMQRHYDIVVANPPYMFRSNMSDALANFLQSGYPPSKGDLYAAFIERCSELLGQGGRLGMITQQSFMFVSSYEKMRQALLRTHNIETMCHTGPRAFDEISGEKVNTTIFALRRENDAQSRANTVGIYFRLVKEPNGEAKKFRFEQALYRLRSGENDPVVYRYRQADFDTIPGNPWVYWITPGIRQWFTVNPNLHGFAKPWVGLQTSDNPRFLRFWWEVGVEYVARNCATALEAQRSGQRWFPHMKGGEFCRWYGNQEYIVNWGNDAAEMKAFAESLKERVASPPGNGPLRDFPFYFKPGVTWTHTTALGLNARLMPKGFICNVEAMAAYPNSEGSNESSILLVLALLNSKIANFVVNQLNPTIHYGSREIGALPLPKTDKVDDQEICELVSRATSLAKADSQEDETTYDFITPRAWMTGLKDVAARAATLAEVEYQLDEEVYRL